MPVTLGPPILGDFGAARIGDCFSGDVMRGIYRAPEVILGMAWDSKIDIWSIGLMVRRAPLPIVWSASLTEIVGSYGTC